MNGKTANKKGLVPIAKIISWAQCGVDPKLMGTGPIPASKLALKKAGWNIVDLNLVESNEDHEFENEEYEYDSIDNNKLTCSNCGSLNDRNYSFCEDCD